MITRETQEYVLQKLNADKHYCKKQVKERKNALVWDIERIYGKDNFYGCFDDDGKHSNPEIILDKFITEEKLSGKAKEDTQIITDFTKYLIFCDELNMLERVIEDIQTEEVEECYQSESNS